jgi:hypothetical protein
LLVYHARLFDGAVITMGSTYLNNERFWKPVFVALKLAAMVLLISMNAPAARSQQYLFNRADFPTGNRPSGVAVADVNGDGRQDLIVANATDGTVSILLGQADGTFGARTDFPAGTGAYNVVAGDFNKDEKVDLAVTGECSLGCGTVSILLGNGDGTFKAPVGYTTGVNPLGLIAADFNGDGNLDLAVLDSCGTSCGFVSVLLGKGDGTFQAKTDYAVGQLPGAIVAEDLNGDGKLDLAVTNTSNSISILLGKGDGTFQPAVDYPSADAPAFLAVANFDGDGIPDLVVTHNGAPWPLTMLKGNGDGTFQPEQQIPLGPSFNVATAPIQALDVNGDGKQDLILSDVGEGGALILLGNADGTFQTPLNYTTGRYPFAFVAEDVNGDGNVDLEIADQESNYITVLLGNGDGTFSPRSDVSLSPSIPSPFYPVGATIADFNLDGIPDVAIVQTSGVLSVLLGKGKGAFEAPLSTGANVVTSGSVGVADFNGDGRPDLAIGNGKGAAVMLGNGDGTFGAPLAAVNTGVGGIDALTVGDFNNDGKQDLVVLGNGFLVTNPIFVTLGNGNGTFQAAKQFWNATSIPFAVATADFNRDGKLDLVVLLNTSSPNALAVMLGNGDGTFQAPVTYPTDTLPNGLRVADLNGDGILDIVVTGDMVDVYLGKGDGTFAAPVYYNGGSFPQQITTGDFNADGKVDIAVTAIGSAAGGSLEILLGNGDGTFQPPVEIADGAAAEAPMAVGDLNQDGTSDLVVAGGLTGVFFMSGPIATLSPASLNFRSVPVGSNASQNITLTNSGNAPLALSSATTTPGYAVTNGCGSSVALRSPCTLGITFAPAAAGALAGHLSLADNAPRGMQMLPLSGSGLADFSVAVASGSSNSETVTAGNPANYHLTVAPVGGFNQNVSFTCVGLPAAATCAVSPASTPLDGTHSVPLAVQVTTTARAVAMRVPFDSGPRIAPRFPYFFVAMMCLCFSIMRLRGRNKGVRELRCQIAVAVALVAIMAASSCGGMGSGGGGSSGTPAGTYTLIVTGSSGSAAASPQHSVQLTLIVN